MTPTQAILASSRRSSSTTTSCRADDCLTPIWGRQQKPGGDQLIGLKSCCVNRPLLFQIKERVSGHAAGSPQQLRAGFQASPAFTPWPCQHEHLWEHKGKASLLSRKRGPSSQIRKRQLRPRMTPAFTRRLQTELS